MSCSFARISDIINRKLGRGRPSEYDDDEKTRAISITTTITITTTATDSIRHGNGQSVFDLNVALMVITNILMILRLYVRGIMAKNLGWDDWLAVVAWGLVMTFSCIEIVLLTKGVGYHIQDIPKETLLQLLSLFPVDKLVFILADGFVRLSILAYLPRINRDRSFMTTYNSLRVAPFFSLEINSGLWCGCLPAFQPLFEWTNNHYYNHYNMRKLSRSSAQEPLNDSWNRDYMTANPHVSIHGQSRDLKGNKTASDAESTTGFAMLENERGIKLTTEFSVHVEDRVYTGEGSEDIVSRTPAWNAF
ncbi:hypothetical protein Forpe1208_v007655 [Fusarium oxysporum f. sp. rapae]|uniref:Rhodopsin domain-containing protein n=1 Tax=Fusarium oxysporum f. sp. rapae TaxID=485398 RepID=A0A8J5U7Q8_FUSOX|nr:hypothetical protein Forpe1208_v007655 [Fusarium oxysporum f. sp. rapae]